MKIAIISDIHSNLEALKAVLIDIFKQRVDKIFCLGDIVGYGSSPRECLLLTRKKSNIIIMGNHEQGVLDKDSAPKFNRKALAGISFSRSRLQSADFNFFKSLPTKRVIPELNITLAHGSYSEPSIWNYLDEEDVAFEELKKIPTRICFVGHTHVPFVFGNLQGLYESLPDDMLLNSKEKYIVNVGSVGQPRDGDCRACYGVLTIKQETVFNLRRVFYDIEITAKGIKTAKLPLFLGERLFRGE